MNSRLDDPLRQRSEAGHNENQQKLGTFVIYALHRRIISTEHPEDGKRWAEDPCCS